ncbi:MAG TPA: hypothetical protein DCS93_07290 [Microscillaceae bacterium]|nr:hypothetical protein [Microscillaceae bacterium]
MHIQQKDSESTTQTNNQVSSKTKKETSHKKTKSTIQAKGSGSLQPIQSKQGKKPPIQAKGFNGKPLHPIQRKGKSKTNGLPDQLRTNMEQMGGVDLSDVIVQKNSDKPAQLKAEAYAQGSNIHLAPGKEQHLPHEAWHVVQQKQGRVQPTIQAKNGANINDNPALEKEADVMGAKANQGNVDITSSSLETTSSASSAAPVVQRYAFINKNQVTASEADFSAEMNTMMKDDLVRNYISKDEFKEHAAGNTDYLGNLNARKPGLWLRFNNAGMNILGENHTKVTLEQVMPAVGSTSFIYEPFSADDLSNLPNTKSSYETENSDRFTSMGIQEEDNKQKYGGESLFPKIGYAMVLALPYFKKQKAMSQLESNGYVGQPIQRYLKISWAYAKDLSTKQKVPQVLRPKEAILANAYDAHTALLNDFITELQVDGFLGDALKGADNDKYYAPLAEVCEAIITAMLDMADNNQDILDQSAKDKLTVAQGNGATAQQQRGFFGDWRNLYFKKITDDAAAQGVRYAGMGNNHLDYLGAKGMPANSTGFDMTDAGIEMQSFESLTQELKNKAVQVND